MVCLNLGIETETLEFKKSTGELKEAMGSICAILNKHQQGELYFGIKPDGTPVGQMITEETLRVVSQKIKNSIEPRIYPEVTKVTIDNRDCIYVRFEGNTPPYFVNGIAKIRVADEDLTLSPQQLAEYIRKSQSEQNRWENLVSSKTLEHIDEDLLRDYILQANESGRLAIGYTDKKTVLNQLELIEGEYLLNAGKVLFSDDLTQDIQMAIFATDERSTFNDIQRYHGPVTKLVDIAETYIRNNIHWRVEFDGSRKRKEIPEIPMDAVREALLNSFCHKDYSSGQSNEVAIYKDRVEIYNPGNFPDGYDPQDFIENPERPIRRNPRIARILYYSKDIESFGTGLKRIADSCQSANVIYQFKMLKSGFVVCFYRESSNLEKDTGIVRGKYGISTGIVRDNIKGLNISQQKVIDYITKNEKITNKNVQELLDVKESRALKIIKQLYEQDLIERCGKGRATYYILKENK